jgi:hypothetical protein
VVTKCPFACEVIIVFEELLDDEEVVLGDVSGSIASDCLVKNVETESESLYIGGSCDGSGCGPGFGHGEDSFGIPVKLSSSSNNNCWCTQTSVVE